MPKQKELNVNDKARLNPLAAPRTARQAANFEKKAGNQLRLIARKLARKAKLDEEIGTAEVELIRLCEGLRAYATTTRQEGERVVHMPDIGSFEWFKTSRIVITDGSDEQAVAEAIEETGGLGKDYIRIKKTINREMFENNPDKLALIPSLEKRPGELFIVKPLAPRRAEHDPYDDKWSHKANDGKRTIASAAQPTTQAAE